MGRFVAWISSLWHLIWTPKAVRDVVSAAETGNCGEVIPDALNRPVPSLDVQEEQRRLSQIRGVLDRVEEQNRILEEQSRAYERLFGKKREGSSS
jgi:hypothetical protein